MQDEELTEEGQLSELDEKDKEEYVGEFINDFENETIIEPLKLSEDQTIIRTHYKFNKQLLIGDWQSALSFISSKIIETINNRGFIFNSIIGLIPLSVYSFSLFSKKNYSLSFGLFIFIFLESYFLILKVLLYYFNFFTMICCWPILILVISVISFLILLTNNKTDAVL
jgi:hypothetical protein